MNDYDEATQTVAADDGSRLSVYEIDDCPSCGGYLSSYWDDETHVRGMICMAAECGFHVWKIDHGFFAAPAPFRLPA